jgi:putative methyltransferase (TIGR04325 family)
MGALVNMKNPVRSGKTSMKNTLQAMLYSARTARMIDRIEAVVPPLRMWHRFAYQSHFFRLSKWERLFHGVYANFQEASEHIPSQIKVGYDNEECSTFLGHKGSIFFFDYPVLFWLQRLLPKTKKIFDLGGYLGISYYSYAKVLAYPDDLRWIIYDVPKVVEEGRRLAESNQVSALEFTTQFSEGDAADVLIAAGSLQVCPQEFADWLKSLNTMPAHILINKLPMIEDASFVTLQTLGPAITPYKIFNRAEFIGSLTDLGYELVDEWSNPDLGLLIPFHPEKTINAFSGMYLSLGGLAKPDVPTSDVSQHLAEKFVSVL